MQEFPGGLVVRIPGFHCHGPGSLPVWETEILQATWRSQKINKILFIYLFLAALGLRCCVVSLVAVSVGYSFIMVRGLLIVVASLVVEQRL